MIEQSIYYSLKRQYIGNETKFRLIVTKVDSSNFRELDRQLFHNCSEMYGADTYSCHYEQNGKHGHEYRVFNKDKMIPAFLLYLNIVQ